MIECVNMVASACRNPSSEPVSKSVYIYQLHAEKAAYDGQPVVGECHIKTLDMLNLRRCYKEEYAASAFLRHEDPV